MRILVTGSAGYIGSHLVPRLKDLGHEVVGVDRVARPGAVDRFVHGDLMDANVRERALEGVECVFHLAAAKGDWGIAEEEYFRDNYEVTKRLIAAAKERGIYRWIFYSTVSAMGPSTVPLDESAPLKPVIPYGRSKAEAEALLEEWAAEEDQLSVLTIRPSVVYGPGHPASTNIYRLIEAIRSGKFVMVGPGEAVKTTSYLENLIAATCFLFTRRESKGVETFIYVDQPVLSTGELVERIYNLLGKRKPSWHLPLSLAKPCAYVADATAAVTGIDLPITAARIEKFNTSTNFDGSAIRDAGFQQPVSNEEALRTTVEWHLRHEGGGLRSPVEYTPSVGSSIKE